MISSGVVPGLKDVPPDLRPPVWPVFFSFRVMVAIGFAMLGLGLWSLWSALARRAVREPPVPLRRHADDAVGLRRRPVRLVHGRDRTPALRRLRPLAHRRRGLAGDARRGARLAHHFRRGLRLHLRLRQLLSRKAAAERAGAARGAVRGADFGDRADKAAKRPLSVPDESLGGGPGRRAPAAR